MNTATAKLGTVYMFKNKGLKMLYHFSIVICNSKNEYLLGERHSNSERPTVEFVGCELEGIELSERSCIEDFLKDTIRKRVGISICNLVLIERFFNYEPRIVHAIFLASIESGTPQKLFYDKIFWSTIPSICFDRLDVYGKQVVTKLSECLYCHYIANNKEQLDDFFENFFAKQKESLSVLEAVEGEELNPPVYEIALKQELVYLRASFIENEKLKKNITVQNYLRLYGRYDLAQEVDAFLDIIVKPGLSLRRLIKETVDKFIAHYDKPTDESKSIYDYCLRLFSQRSPLALQRLIPLIQGFVMWLCTEMWYDAGELGVSMSDRNDETRELFVQQRNSIIASFSSAVESCNSGELM